MSAKLKNLGATHVYTSTTCGRHYVLLKNKEHANVVASELSRRAKEGSQFIQNFYEIQDVLKFPSINNFLQARLQLIWSLTVRLTELEIRGDRADSRFTKSDRWERSFVVLKMNVECIYINIDSKMLIAGTSFVQKTALEALWDAAPTKGVESSARSMNGQWESVGIEDLHLVTRIDVSARKIWTWLQQSWINFDSGWFERALSFLKPR